MLSPIGNFARLSLLLQAMAQGQEYIELQGKERAAGTDLPTRSHHLLSGAPYPCLVGEEYSAARLGAEFAEELPAEKVV